MLKLFKPLLQTKQPYRIKCQQKTLKEVVKIVAVGVKLAVALFKHSAS